MPPPPAVAPHLLRSPRTHSPRLLEQQPPRRPSLPRACISGARKPSRGAFELCRINDQYLDGERQLETETEAAGDRWGGGRRPSGPGIKDRRVCSDTWLVPAALRKNHSEQHQRKLSVNTNGGELTVDVLSLQSSLLDPPRPRVFPSVPGQRPARSREQRGESEQGPRGERAFVRGLPHTHTDNGHLAFCVPVPRTYRGNL